MKVIFDKTLFSGYELLGQIIAMKIEDSPHIRQRHSYVSKIELG